MNVWTALPWLLSVFAISVAVLTGRKLWQGWAVGILAQVFWLIFIVHTASWGLLPTSVFLLVV